MDEKGQEGTYNFFSRRLGGSRGAEHMAQGGSCPPCHPAGAAHGWMPNASGKFASFSVFCKLSEPHVFVIYLLKTEGIVHDGTNNAVHHQKSI